MRPRIIAFLVCLVVSFWSAAARAQSNDPSELFLNGYQAAQKGRAARGFEQCQWSAAGLPGRCAATRSDQDAVPYLEPEHRRFPTKADHGGRRKAAEEGRSGRGRGAQQLRARFRAPELWSLLCPKGVSRLRRRMSRRRRKPARRMAVALRLAATIRCMPWSRSASSCGRILRSLSRNSTRRKRKARSCAGSSRRRRKTAARPPTRARGWKAARMRWKRRSPMSGPGIRRIRKNFRCCRPSATRYAKNCGRWRSTVKPRPRLSDRRAGW